MLINKLAKCLNDRQLKIACAESCTGGSLAVNLTSIAGSSNYFDAGFISYSNRAKIEILNVNSSVINKYGAVSRQVVAEMVDGVIAKTKVDIAVSISGVAGPGGGSKEKPVGVVWFGFKILSQRFELRQQFYGNRELIIAQSVNFAITTLVNRLV